MVLLGSDFIVARRCGRVLSPADCGWSSEVIRGHQRSSEVIRGHQRSSARGLRLDHHRRPHWRHRHRSRHRRVERVACALGARAVPGCVHRLDKIKHRFRMSGSGRPVRAHGPIMKKNVTGLAETVRRRPARRRQNSYKTRLYRTAPNEQRKHAEWSHTPPPPPRPPPLQQQQQQQTRVTLPRSTFNRPMLTVVTVQQYTAVLGQGSSVQ